MRSIASLTLWLFVIGTSLILGAGLYEALVVVPFWSAGAPASLAEGNPLLQVHVRAGHVFWQYFTPVLGLITLLAIPKEPTPANTRREFVWFLKSQATRPIGQTGMPSHRGSRKDRRWLG